MHNEELGLIKKEISSIYDDLSEEKKKHVDTTLRNMPKIPGFPAVTRSLSESKSFKAKDWISISKYICYVMEGIHTVTKLLLYTNALI